MVESNMDHKVTKKKRVSFTLRVLITLLLFALLFRSLSWATLLAAIVHANHVFILLSLPVGALGLIVSAYQWQYLLRAEQIHAGLLKLVKLYLIGTGFSHFLPTGMGGDVVKAFYVGRESGNYAGSASAVVMARLTGFFGMQLVAFSGLLAWHAYFNRALVLSAILLSLLVGGMIGGVVTLTAVLPRILKKSWTKNRILANVIPVGDALIRAMKRPRLLATATLIGVVFWILSALNYYVYAQALRLNVPIYFYFVAIPVASLVAFLPITINGFGLRESAFVYIFATVRVPAATSLLLALLMDVQVLFFGAIGGFLYLTMHSDERTIKLQKPHSSQGRISTAEGVGTRFIASTNVLWFTKEEQDAFNAEALEFDDSTPTLPMLLIEARTAKRGQIAAPQGQSVANPRAVFSKNRRIKLVKDENDVPIMDEILAPSAIVAEPSQADRPISRGL
jgi:glycosyltransferase 2 family protein